MTVSKGKLKAKMLEYFRQVEATGETLVVTDRGREVLEVRPLVKRARTAEVLAEYRSGSGRGTSGDDGAVLEPLPEADWEVMGDDDANPW